jgi:hypothetical protein
LARRFVIGGNIRIRDRHRYLHSDGAGGNETSFVSQPGACTREIRKCARQS